jgi:DNA-binding beta-propeller fold protein YncE
MVHSEADYATVAYNAATGAQRWVRRYNGPGNGRDRAQSVAVSPAGGTVFVTGDSTGIRSGADYATVAYNAATGARRWITRYNGPANGSDFAQSVAVSPVGGTVFVTGASYRKSNTNPDYATVAYNAATGAQRWVRRYNGPGNGYDYATSVAVSPGGGTVYVTGGSTGIRSGADFATVAYNAATGAQRWVTRYNSPGNNGDYATSMAVSPGGGTVYVTGYSQRTAGSEEPDYATVAYSG